jgi:hypothetical protein
MYLLTYLLTPWCRVLLEKLTGFAASKEIPRIYGTRKFITVLTSVRHLSLSWARSIQSPQPPPTSWRFLLILSSHLRLGLPSGLFPSGFPTKTLCTPLPSPIRAHNMMYTSVNFPSRRFKTQQSVHSFCVCLSLYTHIHNYTASPLMWPMSCCEVFSLPYITLNCFNWI